MLMTAAKLMEMIVVMMVPLAVLRRHRERGGERPPSFFFLLGLPPRWEKVSSSGPWCFWPPGGKSLPRDWIWELSVCLSTLKSGRFHRFIDPRRFVTPIGLIFS